MSPRSKTIVILIALVGIFFLPTKKTLPSEKDNIVPRAFSVPKENLEAKSALVVDLTRGTVLFEKNADDVLPLASLTKIVSLLTVFDEISPNEIITVSESATKTEGGGDIQPGEHFFAKDLAAFAMTESSNDATIALVETVAKHNSIGPSAAESWFLDRMRQKAQNLGASTMQFLNTTGLDISQNEAGAKGSARDIMHVVINSYDSFLWRASEQNTVTAIEGTRHILKPTNKISYDLAGLVGSKTGFTDLAGGNLLVLIEHPIGQPIGIVILGSSQEGRFSDVQTIIKSLQ